MISSKSHLLPTATILAAAVLGADATAQLSVDNNDRAAVGAFYRQYFSATARNVSPNWTGSITSCDNGVIDRSFVDATVTRINAYRALMDQPNVTHVFGGPVANNDDEQRAAMMIQSSGVVGQRSSGMTPCWTRDGNWALDRSMQDAAVGTDAIDRALRGDTGDYDQAILMQPVQRWLRIGSTNSHMVVNFPPEENVFPNTGSVAWPPQGYVPHQLVPDTWCFNAQSIPWVPSNTTRHDRFDNATVTVTRNGTPLQVTTAGKELREYCWNGITWTFAPGQLQHGPGMGDVTYQVSVAGITGPVSSYSYSVTVFDPTPPGTFTTFGTGCGAGSGSTLTAGGAPGNRPAIGSTFQVLLGGVVEYGNLAVVNLGVTRWATDLSPIGLTGCSLYTDIQFSVPAFVATHPQPFDLPLPNDPVLIGGRAFLQGAAIDTGVNVGGIVTSNGGEMIFGY